MKKIFHIILFFIFTLVFVVSGISSAKDEKTPDATKENEEKIIADVDGKKIYASMFEKLLQGRSDPQALLDQIISYILLAEQAEKTNFRFGPEVDEQLKMLKEQQLAQFLYSKEIESKAELSDEELNKILSDSDKYKINFQQIIVKSRQDAEDILSSLKKGEDFNKVAKSRSIAKNASKGGQVGYVIPNSGYFEGEFSQEDENRIFKLKDNEISGPIKTREGYALFKAVSRKDLTEEEKQSRKNYLKYKTQKERVEKARDALLDKLRSKAKVEILDTNIKTLEKVEKLSDKYLDLILAKVNDHEIKLKDILPPQRGEYGYQLNTPYLKQANFLKEMINEKTNNFLFLDEAKRLKLDATEEFKEAFNLFKNGISGQAFAMDYVKDLKPAEEEMKSYYEENKDKFKDMPERIRVRHILLSDEEQAKEILKKVKAGEDFNKLARENSICPSSKNGGELPYFAKGRMAPLFEEAAFKLKKGEVSDIVKTNFGYHIIKMEDHKDAGASGFNDVKYEIEQNLLFQKRDKKIRDFVAELKAKAKIKIDQEALKKYQSAMTQATPPGMPPMTGMPQGVPVDK